MTEQTVSAAIKFLAEIRAILRRSELALIGMSIAAGCAAGLGVAVAINLAEFLHALLFALEPDESIGVIGALAAPWMMLIPALGGVLLGLTTILAKALRITRPVDPIQANALHGGRMSMRDSLIIWVQTIISNGFGASVGMEAGHSQLGSAIASGIGTRLKLRRADVRILVGAGTAGAVSAAFGAPLTGAFYAFELVVGSYTVGALPSIAGAAIAGILTAQALGSDWTLIGLLPNPEPVRFVSLLALLLLALLSSLFGIAIMQGVTLLDRAFRASPLPAAAYPMVGGLFVGTLALLSPQVLSSGQDVVLELVNGARPPATALLSLLVLKALASTVSLGSGFRGGLFFASLLLGGILGLLFSTGAELAGYGAYVDPTTAAIIGMTSLGVAIVGGPLTMGFLALEITGDFPLTVVVLAAAAVVSVTVRRTFGYSFATWRLHLRGESIKSAHDIGWIRDLTVRRMMRPDVRCVAVDTTIEKFRRDFPLGSTGQAVALDKDGLYAGLVMVAEVHAAEIEEGENPAIAQFVTQAEDWLLPWMNIKQAADMFDKTQSEVLAVVDSPKSRKVVGLLSEAYVLRRYSEELEKQRDELAGEQWAGPTGWSRLRWGKGGPG